MGADGLMGREGATAQRASTLDNGWCGRASGSAEAGGADLVRYRYYHRVVVDFFRPQIAESQVRSM
jgi:hypothetical protein